MLEPHIPLAHQGVEIMHCDWLEEEDPLLAAIPVVFMTAQSQRHERDLLLSLGALSVIQKPFNPMTLHAEVRRLLETLPP